MGDFIYLLSTIIRIGDCMARLSTCKQCSKKLHPEDKYTHSSKTYCLNCYQKVKRESDEYKQLIEFICINYDIERPTGFMLRQIKEYKDEYLYNYAAMTYTLWYCREVLNKELDIKYGVALIKYYYDEARSYYTQQEKSINKLKELDGSELKTKIVKTNRKVSRNNNAKNNTFNLDDLLKGSDYN